jgi:hypothetical protein
MSIEQALELDKYLPLSFKSPKEQEYIKFLWDAFETNYVHGKFQFAFLAYHMLTMSFVYFNIWQIKQSAVSERSVLRLLKLIACDNSEIGSYTKLVDDRNETAHPNGNIFYSTAEALDAKVREILRVTAQIQERSTPVIDRCYRTFLKQSLNVEEREYPDSHDQIRELLVHKNYMSKKDLSICLGSTAVSESADIEREQMSALHAALEEFYGDNDDDSREEQSEAGLLE